jgi:uncharacterized protein
MAVPTRTCIGCRRRLPASDLVRLTLVEGRPRAWASGGKRGEGRGASIHPTEACLTAAVKTNAFSRAFRQSLTPLRSGSAAEGEGQAFRNLFVDIEVAHGLQQRGAGTP